MRPVIGITTRVRTVEASGGPLGVDALEHTYRDAIAAAGGIPLPLSPVPSIETNALLDRLDGLVLTGGGDVDPELYGGERNDTMYGIDRRRDEFETGLVRGAADRKLPLFAICRGLQVVNVAMGGTLIGDIPSETGGCDHTSRGERVYHKHQHITLASDSLLAEILGETEIMANSIHHQAVRDVASRLREVAWADDRIVEAVESLDTSWPLLAVQWHPEYLAAAGDPVSIALFAAHVSAAAEREATNSQFGDTRRH